jgi:hypothetical protein
MAVIRGWLRQKSRPIRTRTSLKTSRQHRFRTLPFDHLMCIRMLCVRTPRTQVVCRPYYMVARRMMYFEVLKKHTYSHVQPSPVFAFCLSFPAHRNADSNSDCSAHCDTHCHPNSNSHCDGRCLWLGIAHCMMPPATVSVTVE